LVVTLVFQEIWVVVEVVLLPTRLEITGSAVWVVALAEVDWEELLPAAS
jgi:hypothetical protein